MKRILTGLLSLLLLSGLLTACASTSTEDTGESTTMANTDPRVYLVNAPTEEYIITRLLETPNITEVAAVTEDNDPNGNLNTDGGYYSAVYFSVDLINQDDVFGDDLIDKGTDAGGCVEAYKTVEDAEKRNEYLAGFDNNLLFKAGYHTIAGSLVIRTSHKLSDNEQVLLEANIIETLLGGKIDESIPVTQPEITDSSDAIEQDNTEEDIKSSEKIVMPKSAEDYIGSEWTIETITEHFTELGFTNIRAHPLNPSEESYDKNIISVEIKTGWVSYDPWDTGDEFDADAEISIYYNEFPILTIDNCPDLVTILTSKDMGYMTFCKEYDGRYVRFEAYVNSHTTYDGGTSHIISVAGGDYSADGAAGLIIHIGDRSWGNQINYGVDEGDPIIVSGRIDASWAEYYKCVYVETMDLSRR